MGATQRYKQAQQQARIITNENGYLKGMYFTDVPLPEGYVKTLVNFDIDSMSGKLTPRGGLQSTGMIERTKDSTIGMAYYTDTDPLAWLRSSGDLEQRTWCPITFATSKLCGLDFNKSVVQCALYYSNKTIDKTGSYILVYTPNVKESKYYTLFLGDNPVTTADIPSRSIHGQACAHTEFFKKPVGAFLSDQYMCFAYTDGYITGETNLVYTRLGQHILAHWEQEQAYIYHKLNWDGIKTIKEDIQADKYYPCIIAPSKISPSLAVTQGFNMLLDNPYKFECKPAMVHTILGIIPYNKDGLPLLTPKLNDTVTLVAYYNAPIKYVSSEFKAQNYATTYEQILNEDTKEKEDPDTLDSLNKYLAQDNRIQTYGVGTYWRTKDTGKYYMLQYQIDYNEDAPELTKYLQEYTARPAYSVRLSVNIIQKEGNDVPETSLKVIWESRQSTASDWNPLATETVKFSELYDSDTQTFKPLTVPNQAISDPEVIIRLRIIDETPIGNEDADIVLATQTIGITTASDKEATVQSKNYNLAKCTGMCSWEQRLVLWGVEDALNTVFVSAVNDPTYFPYPNNTDTFPDPIMGVYNYGDELIVLTTNELYRLTWNAEGNGWTHTLVQRNLHITVDDLPMNCVIKNMFLFKSGNQYYMMVPKSSSSIKGETTIAPISKPIEGLLENFHEEIYKLVKLLKNDYNLPDFTNRLVYYHSFVDGNIVALNYVYDVDYARSKDLEFIAPATSTFLYVQLRYDTDTRTWSLRFFSTPYILQIPYADAMGQNSYVFPISNTDGTARLQYCEFKCDTEIERSNRDYLAQYLYKVSKDEDVVYYHEPFVGNYQYVDTGNREIDTEHKKRFREFQFKIKNINATELAFHTGFYVDGGATKNILRYETSVDPANNYIIVNPVLDETITYSADGVFMPTVLGGQDTGVYWIVGESALPGRTLWKVRMPVTGKGYTPRAELLSKTEQQYEILGHSWVYRTMDAR